MANAIFIWSGSNFVDVNGVTITVPSMFVTDVNNTTYFYEQNYNGFFPIVLDNIGIPSYAGSGAVENFSGVTLTQVDSLEPFVSTIATDVIEARYNDFVSGAGNILDSITVSPSPLVNAVIEGALTSGEGIQQALTNAAPLLISQQVHFSLKDIFYNWKNGPQVIANLHKFMTKHQGDLDGVNKAVKKITDFKKKLLRQQTQIADSLHKTEDAIHQFETQDTFTQLASAFPGTMGKLSQALSEVRTHSGLQIGSFMPMGTAGVGTGTTANPILSNVINTFLGPLLGGFLPKIINPIDKIMNDLDKLEGQAFNLTDLLTTAGFGSISQSTNVINQFANVLNEFMKTVPVTPETKTPDAVTDTNQMLTSLNDWAEQNLGKIFGDIGIPNPNNNQAIVAALVSKISGYTPAQATRTPPTDPTDSTVNGSLVKIPALANHLNEDDPTMTTPDLVQPTDPGIEQDKSNRAVAQNQANAPSEQRHIKRGSGINILTDVPLRPRNIPEDGSDGIIAQNGIMTYNVYWN